jgi:GDP-L-fucose synthase
VKKPNGTQSKLLDSSRIQSLGWSPEVKIDTGLMQTYEWYLNFKSGEVN